MTGKTQPTTNHPSTGISRRDVLLGSTALAAATAALATAPVVSTAQAQPASKPNVLFIMGDDIGWFNVSAYNMGIMGYRTPNIDRIGKEGAVFTDWYGQQSCTAGRAAFITGQSPIRTGLTKVGLPGATLGLGPDDPSIGDVMKSLGYATGQFGKNHLGDRNEHLPTVHGFDEFFGNLYHLNAEEEPENPDYPKDPSFRTRFGPRGVLKCKASDTDDPTVDRAFGKVGKQVIENTGPLDVKRMETVDEEFLAGAKDFINRQHTAGKPWFCYFNSTRMHIFTHLKKESEGKTGLGIYPDGMVETDGHVGELLQLVDDLGVANDTIVVYTTDNGAEVFTWPDGGTTPFKGEKATNWEGAFRVPCLIRWPGVIKPATIVNDICAHMDFIPTFAAAAGEPDLVAKVMKGHELNGKTFKVHLDGENLLPFFRGEVEKSPREGFLYWSDDGDVMALRAHDWKIAFIEQHAETNPETPLGVWQGDFTKLRAPMVYNLRSDPFERGPTSIYYADWVVHRVFLTVPAQVIVGKFLESFKEFPPRAKAASFSLSDVMDKITTADPGQN
ncbi:arylsulfatase [Mesorhizobium sophorae]|uniref:arylsulfatase n=1 Tax=Mesorhizobium sophorae TaxID=1300294 RepID=UPI000BA3E0D0|nr:arylsulfatase [Mesorhizobium sophorae]